MRDPGDSYCGIYCGACSVRRHGATGQRDGFAACCAGVPDAELSCGGCTSERLYAGCRVCTFRDCATRRGLERCGDCADYPCADFGRWQAVARLLPHVREAAPSLATIRREGVAAWLEAQRRRWSCPRCGAPLSWYQERCGGCGRDVGGVTYAMAGLRRALCRVLLPRVYRQGKTHAAG
jgi:hypothetical protein